MTSSQVEQFLQNLNDAWLTRDYAALKRFYDDDVVLLPPDAGEPLLGRDAMLATYEDFHSACEVVAFTVTDQSSWAFRPAASAVTTVVHMRFAIDYRFSQAPPRDAEKDNNRDPQFQSEQGMDVYTLVQTTPESAPKIVWRAQFTL